MRLPAAAGYGRAPGNEATGGGPGDPRRSHGALRGDRRFLRKAIHRSDRIAGTGERPLDRGRTLKCDDGLSTVRTITPAHYLGRTIPTPPMASKKKQTRKPAKKKSAPKKTKRAAKSAKKRTAKARKPVARKAAAKRKPVTKARKAAKPVARRKAAKKPVVKAVAKKVVAKKVVAKKPVAKKVVAKKVVAKKPVVKPRAIKPATTIVKPAPAFPSVQQESLYDQIVTEEQVGNSKLEVPAEEETLAEETTETPASKEGGGESPRG